MTCIIMYLKNDVWHTHFHVFDWTGRAAHLCGAATITFFYNAIQKQPAGKSVDSIKRCRLAHTMTNTLIHVGRSPNPSENIKANVKKEKTLQ